MVSGRICGADGGIQCPVKVAAFQKQSVLSYERGRDDVTSDLFLSYDDCPWKDVRTSHGSWFPCWSACRCTGMQIRTRLQNLSPRERVLRATAAASSLQCSSHAFPQLETNCMAQGVGKVTSGVFYGKGRGRWFLWKNMWSGKYCSVNELPIGCRGVSCSYTSRFLIGFKREQQEGEIFRKVCSKRSIPGETWCKLQTKWCYLICVLSLTSIVIFFPY